MKITAQQRKKIFALTKHAYDVSGCAMSVDGFRHEQMDALGIESLSNCPAEKGLKLMNRLHRIAGDVPPGVAQNGQTGVSAPQKKRGPAGGRPKGILEWTGEQHAQMKKVEALLADMGLPWDYADSIAKRMFGVGVLRVDTLNGNQMRGVITALVKRQKKQGGRRYGPGNKAGWKPAVQESKAGARAGAAREGHAVRKSKAGWKPAVQESKAGWKPAVQEGTNHV